MKKTNSRGRPSLHPTEASYQINTRVPAGQFDRAQAKARRERVPISELMRRALSRELDEDDDD